MPLTYLLIAFVSGAVLPMQAAMNGQLARTLGGPIWAAAFTSLSVVAFLVILNFAGGRALPRMDGLAAIPWWAWLSGLCGAIFLTGTTFAVSRLGAANLVALVITGQIIAAMLLDKFGLLGLTPQPLSTQRLLAAGLMAAGAVLISAK